MKIAVVKPDWRILGGFEKVLGVIERDLSLGGHDVSHIQVDVPTVARVPFGIEPPVQVWERCPEWFTHLSLLEAFRGLDLSWADLVISTQPPSYAIDHPHHLALFYHHARIFYDLEDVYIRAGFAPELLHTMASALLRQSEAQDLQGVSHFLAGSGRVQQRLHEFQGSDLSSSIYQAAGPAIAPNPQQAFEHVLCVSRHEFTKRTELAALGIAAADGPRGVLAGSGGRLPYVRALTAALADGRDPAGLTDEETWLNRGLPAADQPAGPEHPLVRIMGRVDDDELAALYRSALCVVAPAYDEDDGLTVVEAMSHGKPVIVCADGGGLTASVQDGLNGFVVEPTAAGIARAIRTLAENPELVVRMSAAAQETAMDRTPERAGTALTAAIELVMSGRH